jgi:polar amino acid transport system substrate-binding protein
VAPKSLGTVNKTNKEEKMKITTTIIILVLSVLSFQSYIHGQESKNASDFVVRVFDLPPFLNVETPSEETPNGSATVNGIAVDLWNEIANRNGWNTIRYQSYDDFGDFITPVIHEDGRHNEISIGAITMTERREMRGDFTVSFYNTGLSIAIHERDMDSRYYMFFVNLFKNIIFAFVILSSFLVFAGIIFYISERKNRPEITLWNSIYWAVVTNTTTGYGDVCPQTISGKTWTIMFMYLSLFINMTFIGFMTNSANYSVSNHDFDIEGKTICALEDSASLDYLTDNNIPHEICESMDKCLEMLSLGEVDGVMGDALNLRHHANEHNNDIIVLDKIYRHQSYAFVIPEGNEDMLEKINRSMIQILQEDWFFERINMIE